jgi:hypothetical protein
MAAPKVFAIASATLAVAVLSAILLLVQGTEPAEARVGGVLDANCSGTFDFNSAFSGEFRAQTFTAEHTGKLTDARVRLARFSSVGGKKGVKVQIRTLDTSGAPGSTVLASTIIPRSSVGGFSFPKATAHFDRARAARVVDGQDYALVMKAREGYFIAGTDSGCPGSFYFAPASGTPFADTGRDLLYSVYVRRS